MNKINDGSWLFIVVRVEGGVGGVGVVVWYQWWCVAWYYYHYYTHIHHYHIIIILIIITLIIYIYVYEGDAVILDALARADLLSKGKTFLV